MREQIINGARMAYLDAGSGEPVLLLHGLGGSSDDWRRQVGDFSTHHRVIIPDLRGFGTSERREPFTIQQHARDAIALLEALQVSRAHVLGTSMGGAIALEVALAEPARVGALVLANSAPGFRLTNWQRRRMAWLRVVVALLLGVGGVARLFGRAVFPRRSQGRLMNRFLKGASRTSRWVYLANLRSLTRWSAEKRLPSVAVPTLVLGAEHDFTSTAEKRRWTARIPGARLVEIPNSRHHSELDSPRRFNAEVLSFLARHPLGG